MLITIGRTFADSTARKCEYLWDKHTGKIYSEYKGKLRLLGFAKRPSHAIDFLRRNYKSFSPMYGIEDYMMEEHK